MPREAFRKVDRRSIRSKRVGQATILVGCPKGHYHPRARSKRKCDVGMIFVEKRGQR